MSEKSYYKCTLKIEYEGAKGRLKTRREEYIVEAIGPTDVEAKVAEHMKGGTEDYEISSVVLTNIISIIR